MSTSPLQAGTIEQHYMLALNNARMALWESTIVENRIDKGEVIWIGNGANLLGIQNHELRHGFAEFLQCVYEVDRDYVQRTIQEAIDKTTGYELEYRVVWPDGSIHWIAARAEILKDTEQKPCRTFGIVWDINHKKITQEKLNLSLRASGMAIWESYFQSDHIHLSKEGLSLLGISGESASFTLKGFLRHVHPEDMEHVKQILQDTMQQHSHYQMEYRVVWPNEEIHWICAKGQVYADANKKPVGSLGLMWDITKEKEAERELADQKELAEVTLSSIGDGLITIDTDGNTRYLNRVAEYLTGWPSEAASGTPIAQVFHVIDESSGEEIENIALKCLKEGRTIGVSSGYAIVSADGRHTSIEDSASPIIASDGKFLGAVVVIHDISHEQALRHELSWQAAHDPLTGLINRREFDIQFARALANAKHTNEKDALLYMDLDQFKLVNDTCGHVAGDELLRQLTFILQSKMRGSDIFSRLGGDEFAVLLIGCSLNQAHYLADELRQAVKNFRFVWDHHIFEIGVSIGLVPLDASTLSAAEAMSAADRACYIAKEQGRNKVHVFQANDLALAERHGEMLWIAKLNHAFRHKRFLLYCQPIMPLNGAGDAHTEILLRLLDEDGALISPGAFIPAAERYDQINSLDRWVIENSLRYLHSKKQLAVDGKNRSTGHSEITQYSINLSGASLGAEGLLEFIERRFSDYNIDPTSICFEITETAVVRNIIAAKKLMTQLRKLGCRFALDDFGSGLSSFSYLKNFPVDYLKIDGSFIKEAANDAVNRAMVESINHVGHIMGIKTIAEFVEDETILWTVREIGLDYAQGHAIGSAQPLL
jgi:diguanylate cyclase (GGDEF)-like protein/PAS domain S-box-containing protein